MTNNVGQFVTKRAEMNADAEAVVDVGSGTRLTYRQLNARCNQVAHALTGAGVSPGDRIATLLPNSSQFVETFFGTAKIGGVIVALNWRLLADELAFILSDSGSETLVFASSQLELVGELHDRGSDATPVTTWIHVGDPSERPDFAVGYEDMVAAAAADEPEITSGDDDLLFIMYTSGTTGLPKGVMHSHDTALWSVITANATADVRWDDIYLICLPLFHVGALNPMLTVVYRGGKAVVMSEFDPVKVWETFDSEHITTTLAVPAALQFMLLCYEPDKHEYADLRWIMSGAAPVPETLIKTYESMGIEIHQVYGLTETCGPACLINPDDALVHAGSTGKAFFHTEVKVVDENGREVGVDEPGEVLIRAPHVMVGYWNRPDDTADSIVDGWLHTGDIARVDADGFVYIQDRVKDMVISGGENVYPAEIENVILSHEHVSEVAVIGVESAKWGESPLAVVVRTDESLTAEDVLGWCRGRMASFKQPKAVEFVDAIPRTLTGKVLKRVLREQFPGPAPE